ncbi:hypothetical protein IU405_13000 [Polaribacter sp. BAL334]|uniref:hypothetical protein n=1 Tax=Polaribacter sp. BAL334 TaxID=1708178 RepID=UPI0018D2263E|nr:hypothetical protein [Polaribacter sp. BAL334]MBG7613165.1 hypothetical protein [Polaribacter sp. BAL334]
MNEIATLFEFFFNWDTYQELLNAVYNNLDYGKIGWLMIIITTIVLVVFYKFWDPISASKLKWLISLLGIGILSYVATSSILYNNVEIIQHLGIGQSPDGDYFIFQMSMISFVYSVIIAFVLSIIPFRQLSTNNSKNPF